MKGSRLNKMVAGIVIMFAGIGLFLDNLNLIEFSIFSLWPFLILYAGMRLWSDDRRILGGILLGLGAIFGLQEWLKINAFELIFPILFIYVGYRLIRSRQTITKEKPDTMAPADPVMGPVEPPPATSRTHRAQQANGPILRPAETKSTLIGDFHLTSGRFELANLHIWHGIGDVVIDLSRAMVPEEETLLMVNGWVGDVTIYVPVDLPVTVSAEVWIGDMEVFGHRQGGLNRQILMRSDNYDSSSRKVKLIISLIIGDIDVKYI